MNYKQYEVTCTYARTNKRSTRTIQAQSETQLIEILTNRGYIGPFDIKTIPFQLPTKQQIVEAEKLGISIPEKTTFEDANSLIEKELNEDKKPSHALLNFAEGRGCCFSYHIGEKALYNLIWDNLALKDKIAFFTFSIYEAINKNVHAHLDASPHKDSFYDFSAQQLHDEAFLQSLREYAGEDLQYLGMLYCNDGDELNEGILYTTAYKSAISFLKDQKLISTKPPKKISRLPSKGMRLSQKTNDDIENVWRNPLVAFFCSKKVILVYTAIMVVLSMLIGFYDGIVSFLFFSGITFGLYKLLSHQRQAWLQYNENNSKLE